MERQDVDKTIQKFITDMHYIENEHVLGCFFYGSFLTGFNHKKSDIDLHIIFDNSDPYRLIRGNKFVNGTRIEYFEKPIDDLYLSINNDFNRQNNALLSRIVHGTDDGTIIFQPDLKVYFNIRLNKVVGLFFEKYEFWQYIYKNYPPKERMKSAFKESHLVLDENCDNSHIPHYKVLRPKTRKSQSDKHKEGEIYTKSDGEVYTIVYNTERRVCELVWEAFQGEIPQGFRVCHIDGNKHNNRLDNLKLDKE